MHIIITQHKIYLASIQISMYSLKKNRSYFLTFLCLLLGLVPYTTLSAEEYFFVNAIQETAEARFTNENWLQIPHPKIREFAVMAGGGGYGTTTTNIPFVQYPVQNDYGLRIQRFEIQDHYHYIVEGQIMNTLQELSVALAVA